MIGMGFHILLLTLKKHTYITMSTEVRDISNLISVNNLQAKAGLDCMMVVLFMLLAKTMCVTASLHQIK